MLRLTLAPKIEPVLGITGHWATGSAIFAGRVGSGVRPSIWSGFEFYHVHLSCRYFYREIPSRQLHNFILSTLKTQILTIYFFLVYVFQLAFVIFTYLHAHCLCGWYCNHGRHQV